MLQLARDQISRLRRNTGLLLVICVLSTMTGVWWGMQYHHLGGALLTIGFVWHMTADVIERPPFHLYRLPLTEIWRKARRGEQLARPNSPFVRSMNGLGTLAFFGGLYFIWAS